MSDEMWFLVMVVCGVIGVVIVALGITAMVREEAPQREANSPKPPEISSPRLPFNSVVSLPDTQTRVEQLPCFAVTIHDGELKYRIEAPTLDGLKQLREWLDTRNVKPRVKS